MPNKFFTPYTLGCKKCREEFDLQNNNQFQLKQIGRRQPPDNTLSVTVSPNDSIYEYEPYETITVHCTKHKEHVKTLYAYDYDAVEDIAYARHDQFQFDCIVNFCEAKGLKIPAYDELKKYHPSNLFSEHFMGGRSEEAEYFEKNPYQAAEVKKYEKLICDIYNHGEDYDEEGNYIPVAERKNHIEIKDSEGK